MLVQLLEGLFASLASEIPALFLFGFFLVIIESSMGLVLAPVIGFLIFVCPSHPPPCLPSNPIYRSLIGRYEEGDDSITVVKGNKQKELR